MGQAWVATKLRTSCDHPDSASTQTRMWPPSAAKLWSLVLADSGWSQLGRNSGPARPNLPQFHPQASPSYLPRQSIGAHCWNPKHGLCRTNRTMIERESCPPQGRSLGFLVAWLWASVSCDDFDAHQKLARREGQFDPRIHYDIRKNARLFLGEPPQLFQWLLVLERKKRDNEGEEPALVAY